MATTAVPDDAAIHPDSPSTIPQFVNFHHHPETLMWIVVVVAMVADIGLTSWGLHYGLTELNPLASALIEAYGLGGMILIKVVPVGVAIVGWHSLAKRDRWTIPLVLGLPWITVVGINLVTIITRM